MKRFIDVYEETTKTHLDQLAIVGEKHSYTYRELDELSGKIYAYLKDKGIGREDFVMIILPRDAKITVSVTGVIKAGAAFVLLEDTYPDKRADYIYSDCGCKIKLNEELFDYIMTSYDTMPGHEKTDVHDAAYAVYTSGSTGNPKGVLHEYGNVDQTCHSSKTWYSVLVKRTASYAPFYFIAGIIDYICSITNAYTSFIVPHALTRDFNGCRKFIRDNGIERIYLPPSLLRIYDKPEECLKIIITGSEPANGLSYYDNPYLINVYSMSEAGFYVLNTSLSTPEDVAPVGKPNLEEINLCLLDEDDNVIEGEGQGELCFVNEYVRGYINLPEQTKKAWRNGLFHTNDCVRRDRDGSYSVVGRFDDMIKINGNRVEPVEIEMHIKNITNLKQVVAKGFAEADRSYIVLYYIVDEAKKKGLYKDGELVFDKERLKSLIPYYMIPTYYVGLDEFPLTPTGKVSRLKLEAPDSKNYTRKYIAPDNQLEKILCDNMAKVLRRDRVSVIDDFYELGGDSMGSMKYISLCSEAGIGITSKNLYDCRTPRKLARLYRKQDVEDIDKIDSESRMKKWPLLPSQIANIAFGWKSEKENAFNLNTLYRLKEDVDIYRLINAANQVLDSHPGMHIRIGKDEKFYQIYEESYKPDSSIIELKEKEFRDNIKNLDMPYNIYKEKLYRCNIYKTEVANYFFLNLHHVVSDGTSRKLVLEQIAKVYNDNNYAIPKDYYYYYLEKRFEEERWDEKLDENDNSNIINFDRNEKGIEGAVIYREDIAPVDLNRDGSFFVAALAMAVAKYNGRDTVRIKEVFSGRNEVYSRDIAGELAISISVKVEVDSAKSFDDIRKEIRMQELYEASHPVNHMNINTKGNSGIRFNYQKGTMDDGCFNELCEENLFESVRGRDMYGTFSLNIIESSTKDTVDAMMAYATSKYNKSTIEKVMEYFIENVKSNL